MRYFFLLIMSLMIGSCGDESGAKDKEVRPEDFYGTYRLDGRVPYVLEIDPGGKVYLSTENTREQADWKWVEEGKVMDWIAPERTIRMTLTLRSDTLIVEDEQGNKTRYLKE